MKHRKGPFDSNIDLKQIPSYQTRFMSMDKLGSQINMQAPEPTDLAEAMDKENLREKLGSHQDIRSNPGIILRRWGMKK